MNVDFEITGEKTKLLIEEIEKNGIILSEQPIYKYPNTWDKYRPEKPWEIHE